MKPQILSYGGGHQTVAMIVLVAEGVLPRPDRIVCADTSREVRSTWNYLVDNVQPYLEKHGLPPVEIAPHSLATVDLYGKNGDMLLPAYTSTGKLPTFCSTEWKQRVVRRWLRGSGTPTAEMWIGYAFDERKRWNKEQEPNTCWPNRFPLVEAMVRKADCVGIARKAGLADPEKSRCWQCPHQLNEEWRSLPPDEFEKACQLDDFIREEDAENNVFLHHSGVPLREADLNAPDRKGPDRQCGLGLCMV